MLRVNLILYCLYSFDYLVREMTFLFYIYWPGWLTSFHMYMIYVLKFNSGSKGSFVLQERCKLLIHIKSLLLLGLNLPQVYWITMPETQRIENHVFKIHQFFKKWCGLRKQIYLGQSQFHLLHQTSEPKGGNPVIKLEDAFVW